MTIFTDNDLERAGLGLLPPAQRRAYTGVLAERLGLRAGARLFEGLDAPEQRRRWRRLAGAPAQVALAWLQIHYRDAHDVICEERDALLLELAAAAPQICALETALAAPPDAWPMRRRMSPQTAPTMSHIHELLRQEFGRMAPSLDEDGTTQLVHLPGGRYAVVCRMTTPATITVSKTVALDLTFEQPGLADFLLREHADWLFGRFERVGGALRVEHTVTAAHVDGETLRRIVVAVHSSAFRAEGVLASCGVIDVEEER